jgi:hypothetical protein
MRKTTLLAVAAGLALTGSVANAAITVSSTRVVGTGANSAFDIVRFFAKTTPGSTEDTSTGLQSAAITLTTFATPNSVSNPTFHFKFTDLNTDGFADWDPTGKASAGNGGQQTSALLNTTTIGSFVGARPYDKASNAQGSFDPPPGAGLYPTPDSAASPGFSAGHQPAQQSFDADGDGTLGNDSGDVNPITLYQDKLNSFRVEGFNSTTDTSLLTADANGGRGALFAVAVVPHNAGVRAQGIYLPNFTAGGLATSKTDAQDINAVDPVPEPTSLTLLGIGALGLMGRRRRKA